MVDVEEVECFVANMIFKGLIKGYISHERQIVVLAQNGAFPRLADRKKSLRRVNNIYTFPGFAGLRLP